MCLIFAFLNLKEFKWILPNNCYFILQIAKVAKMPDFSKLHEQNFSKYKILECDIILVRFSVIDNFVNIFEIDLANRWVII